MNSVFPIQQRQGTAFQTLNDFLKLLENVQSGRYIITQGHGWHSGIHLTSKEAPWGQGFRPIQAMLAGKLVAYRFNQQYLESDFQTLTDSVTLKYSNNFVLLEHEYLNPEATETTPQEEKSFTFYTLYMHLAPSSDIGANSTVKTHYQFTQSLNAHFFQNGSEPSEATKDGDPQLLPSSTVIEYLDADSEKTSLYQGYHYIKCRVARIPSDSEHLKGKIVWIASGKESKFDRLQNAAFFVPAPLPKWMSSQDLKTDGTVVVNPKSNEEDVMVMTGEAVGYMGLHQSSRDLNGTVEQDFRVHIECFSPTKPPEFFLKSISPDKQDTYFHYIDGSNDGSVSSGEVSPENDFFVEIAQYVAEQSRETFDINSYQRVGQLRSYLNNKRQYLERLVVKHKSEWHSENTTTMGEKIYLYALKVLEDKLSQTHLPDSYENSRWRNEIFLPSFGRFKDHEMERMAKFSWLDQCSELSLDSELWYFWPLALKLSTQCKLQIDFAFIRQLEGSKLQGYVPNPEGSKSGVTIGTGFDLGARNLADLNNLGLSSSLIDKFTPYLGLKKNDAVNKLEEMPLSITSSEAETLEGKVKDSETNRLINYFDQSESPLKFKCLPAQAQTVIASVSYQHGYLPIATPGFWGQAITQDWQGMYDNLMDFQDDYPTRRTTEAELIKELL